MLSLSSWDKAFCKVLNFIFSPYVVFGASRVALLVENLPPVQETRETQVRSLGQEDPLEKKVATHSSTLAGRIPWMEESGGLQSMGSQSQT